MDDFNGGKNGKLLLCFFFLAGLRDQWMNTSLFIQFLISLPSSFSLVGKIGLFFVIHFVDSSQSDDAACFQITSDH